ncbi:hypothetical protein PG988_003281 [Apiospora saccharicola]
METPIIHPADQASPSRQRPLFETEPESSRQQPLVLIPELFESSACLRYLGFKTATAEKVWSKWEQSPLDHKNHYSVLNDAIAHISSTDGDKDTNDCLDDGPWHELLTRIGVNDDFRKNLMAPDWQDLRILKSCKYWVKYFFNHRCDTLVEIYKFSRERCERPAHILEKLGRGPEASLWNLEKAKPGFKTLWVGESYNRTRGRALDDADWRVKCWRSLKSAGHEFWNKKALNFTSYRQHALDSIAWHKKNDPNACFFIVQVEIPDEAISNLGDWKMVGGSYGCTGGYFQDMTLHVPRLDCDHRVVLGRNGSHPDDYGGTRGPSQNGGAPCQDGYAAMESALCQHVVAHMDSNDFLEIERILDSNAEAAAEWDDEDDMYPIQEEGSEE